MKSLNSRIFVPAAALCLILVQGVSAFGQLSPKLVGPFKSAYVENVTADRLNRALYLTERLQADKELSVEFDKILTPMRTLGEAVDDLKQSKTVVSSQYTYLFLQFPELEKMFNNFITEQMRNPRNDSALSKARNELKANFQQWFKDNQKNIETITFAKAEEPLLLLPEGNKPAYQDFQI